MKKSFTLIELIVSIALFFMIVIFLYKTIDITKITNDFFSSKVSKVISTNKIKKVLFEDIVEADIIELQSDNNKNTILYLETTNMYHNVFYKHVTYIVSRENKLIRIESLKKFDKLKLNDEFFKEAYIDILINKIEKFKVAQLKDNNKVYAIILKKENEDIQIVSSIKK